MNTDTYTYAVQRMDGTLFMGWEKRPLMWDVLEDAERACRRIGAGCTVVKVRITTDLGEKP